MRNLPGLTAWIAGAILCLVSVHVPAQTIFQYPVTAKDVDPGVDHGNSDASLPEQFQKQMVFYRSQHPPGTIIVDTRGRHLYLIKDETHAMRYGIGVGRDGFTWQGLLQISRKAELARLASAAGNDRAPTLFAALHGRWPRQPARSARNVSRQHCVSHPRHQCAGDDRAGRLVRLLPPVKDDVADL